MTKLSDTKNKKRNDLLMDLISWHEERGIHDFPKRLGISTNNKKFRELSFRVEDYIDISEATADNVIVNKQEIYGFNHTLVAYSITYRIWYPTVDGKKPGILTIRFHLYPSVVGVVTVGNYIIAVEHDCIPLQMKTINMPRMFGTIPTDDVNTLGSMIIQKEYPFILDNLKSVKVRQLGQSVFFDPSSRNEENIMLHIELELNKAVTSKEDLAEYIDVRNKELLIHHIYTVEELLGIYKERSRIQESNKVSVIDNAELIDSYSLLAISYYFMNKLS